MFCKNCGVQISEETKFCPSCGAAVNSEQTIGQQNQEIPKTAMLFHHGSGGVYEFLKTLEPNLDFIWARSGNDIKAQFLGIGAVFVVNTYILAFNNENLYIFQLSKTSGKKIINIDKYAWREITSFTVSGSMVGKMLKFVINNKKLNFRTQKIFSMENQEERIEKLLNLQK